MIPMAQQIDISEVRAGDTVQLRGFRHDGEFYTLTKVVRETQQHFSLGYIPYYRLYAICGLKLPAEKRRERQVWGGFGAVDGVQFFLVSRAS
jgi:hypothetical protein